MTKEKIGIIVDSSIGIFDPKVLGENVRQVFFHISDCDGNQYLDDNQSLTREQIFAYLKKKKSFQTAGASVGSVIQMLEVMLPLYDKVIILTVSSGLSGFYKNIAYLEQKSAYANRVFIIDTREIGYPILVLVQKVQRMFASGEKFSDILAYCKNFHTHNFSAFSCKNWTNLKKGGRIHSAVYKVLNMVKACPLILFHYQNLLGAITYGFKNVVEKFFSCYKKSFPNCTSSDYSHVVFYNNNMPKQKADYFRNKISMILQVSKQKIIETFAPNCVLVHTDMQSFGLYVHCPIHQRLTQ